MSYPESTLDSQSSIQRERRQRALLRAVSDFARALVSPLDDLADVLQQLTARLRSLLDADLAILGLVDEDAGVGRAIASDGMFTDALHRVSIPLGTGLTGKAAATGDPARTSNYLDDTSFEHDPATDAAVADEGLRAALAIPLRAEQRTIGVLIIGHRHPHRHAPDEVQIAQTFADLAAVAISTQEHITRERARAEPLREQLAASEALLAQQRRIVQVDEALIEALAAGGGLAALREGMSRELGRDVRLADLTVRFALDDSLTEMIDSERALVTLSAQQGMPVTGRRDDGSRFTVMTAGVKSGRPIASVLIEGDVEPQEAELLRRSARMLDTFLRAHHRELGDLSRRRHDLILELLSPPPGGPTPTALLRLDEFGVREGEPFRIVVADGSVTTLDDLDHRFEVDFGSTLLRARIDDRLVAIAPERAFAAIESELGAPGARRRGALLVGHSPTLHMLNIAPEEYDLVLRVVEAARRSGHDRILVSLESYGALGAFLTRVTIEPTKLAIEQILGPLLNYDREHGTALVNTAAAYLDAAHSVADTAKQLHVHENTVRQRLERITTLLGPGWAGGRRGLDIHVMLAAHRLVGSS
ncbi:GAF domain-containing protein [uncultured Gulosibacter sp.]|uniref:helix-turn-helix domain-containing protein n=1 Tax=uncultured Gulosibacter sp. TaxID=1339167 RepID=UPI00288AEDA0|nr:GAF domain-containing protein [uncultured Gulosibacter sp.]